MSDAKVDTRSLGMSREPDIETVHKDIALSNTYRLELSKTLLALAAGIFAFTISFPPQLTRIDYDWLIKLAWVALAISMVGGLAELFGWEMFYISYRNYDFKGEGDRGENVRRHITRWRRFGRFCQFAGFAIGVIGIGLYILSNFGNIKLATRS